MQGPTINRQILVARRPVGRIKPQDFEIVERPLTKLKAGQAMIQVLYLSIDPTARVWMSEADQYMRPVSLNSVMRGGAIGRVIESQSSKWRSGDLIGGLLGWQDYYIAQDDKDRGLEIIPENLSVALPTLLGACGLTGLTAYFGLQLVKPRPGETAVVSAAAGAVGSVAGQIAKIYGCKVIGIAGGEEKCAWLTDALKFDNGVNYKSHDWHETLHSVTPDGVDIDFENVGGEIMDAVLARMNSHGRVALCGLLSGYNTTQATGNYWPLLMKRLSLHGFIVSDFFSEWAEARRQLAEWIAAGKIQSRETIVEGLESAPEAVNSLFDGRNFGKLVVRVAGSYPIK